MERKRREGMKDQDRAWQCTKADVTIKNFPPRCVQLPSMHFTNVRHSLGWVCFICTIIVPNKVKMLYFML